MAKHSVEIYLRLAPAESDQKKAVVVGHMTVDGLVIPTIAHNMPDAEAMEHLAEFCERAAASLRAVAKRKPNKSLKEAN